MQLQEGILKQVFGVSAAAREADAKRVESRRKRRIKLVEGGIVAARVAAHDLVGIHSIDCARPIQVDASESVKGRTQWRTSQTPATESARWSQDHCRISSSPPTVACV